MIYSLKAVISCIAICFCTFLSFPVMAEATFVRPEDRNTPRNARLMVFVHGITSDGKAAWLNEESGAYWPQIVKDDDTFFGTDIIVYDYPSSYFGNGLSVSDLAAKFAEDMLAADGIDASTYDDVVFVAHSMGGLIVRRALLDSEVLRSITPAIFTFATPSGGSSLASVLDFFSSNSAVRDLRRSIDQEAGGADSFLVTLRNSWRNTHMARQTWSYCAFETIGTTKWLVFTAIPVDKLSAELLCDSGLTGIAANHSDIVRPINRFSHQHQQLVIWYIDTFPDSGLARRQEATEQVVIARCSTDHYGEDLYSTISSEIVRIGAQWRFTREMPQDWRQSFSAYIWELEPPKVLVLHYSCFQQGPETTEGRNESIVDFNNMLHELQTSGVKVVTFSRGFVRYPTFAHDNLALRDGLASHYSTDCQRLYAVPVPAKLEYATARELQEQFQDVVESALNSDCD
ncbi:alpha/beta hydrolase family protein [Litoreibacter halocynthiae]|uniref:Alpha/beta hydrolase family protein n=1 Tax=Litoreibacter halocynthiae TaxID=1242689 RepID=A0A4R7LFT3_9RHOB|nr:alpha/beta hydrolase [Litoreibacter halocynthiae]TDT74039.1 alpha/beta hydrolase family protein [Litoreibacter halocynthiae]